MKKLVLPAIALLGSFLTAQAQYFSTTNLVVVQQVTSGALGGGITLVQLQTNGTSVSSTNLPASGASSIALSTSTTEGFVTLSANDAYVVLAGYNVSGSFASATNVGLQTAAAVPRAVATLDAYGNYALPISNTNIYSTFNIRGAASDGLGNFWVSGSGGTGGNTNNGEIGVVFVGTATQPTNVSVTETGTGNERCLDIYNGNLYIGTGSQTHGIFLISNVAGTYPEVEGSLGNNSNVIAMNSASGPYAFQINSAGTLAYVADDNNGGVVKFTSSGPGGVWVSNYTLSLLTPGVTTSTGADAYGCAVDFTKNPPVIYATSGEGSPNRLVRIVDTGASAVGTTIGTPPAGTVWRGVRFGPGAYPVITGQPASVTNDDGQTATFSVTTLGTPAFSYQWYSNSPANTGFVAIPGATNSTLSLPNVTAGQNGSQFFVFVGNAYGFTQSSNATLTTAPPGPPINVVVTPASQVVNAESTATLTVNFTGGITGLSYGWTLNGAPLHDGPLGGSTISGSTTGTLTISTVFAPDDGSYVCLVTNSLGNGSNSTPAIVEVNDPAIVTNIVGGTNFVGGNPITMTVGAIGTGLTYQWLSNGVPVSGANLSTYTVPSSGTPLSSLYSVIVYNSSGQSVTNGPVTVSYTAFLLNDTFSYPNGNLFGDAGSPWTDINGSNPELVINGRVQINESNFTTDAQSLFIQPVNNTVVWASFIINLQTLPTNAGGVYFANIEGATDFQFVGRLFTLTSNNANVVTPTGTAVAAFPGTYRLGVAGAQNDYTGSSITGPTAVVPIDLAPGIDYQVVYYVDLVNDVCGLAINPAAIGDVQAISPGGPSSGITSDNFTPTNAMAAFGLRQRQGEGILQMDNLEVSYDYNASGSGYPVVTGGIVASTPVIGLQPVGVTNYSGNTYVMEVAASGVGAPGTGLGYAWYRNGSQLSDNSDVTGTGTQALNFQSLAAIDDGTYYCIVTGAAGSPVQSSNAVVSVNTTVIAPSFTLPGGLEPVANTTNSQGGSVSFTAKAVGTGPISYQWYYNNGTSTTPANSTTTTLTLTGLNTNESGSYYVVATGGTGLQTPSSNAVLVVTGPQTVTIGYLRSLLDPVTYQPANETTFYTITGVCTIATNLTTGNTSSCYLQDSTGGINLFVTFGSDFRPQLGDLVTATGTLSTFVDNFELDVSEGGFGYVDTILSHSNALPTPILLNWTNNTAPLSPFIATNVEGSVVMLTNLWFEAYSNGAVFVSGQQYTITNNTGITFTVFVSDQDTNLVVGQPIPQFASSIAGPLVQDNTTVGIEFTVYSQLVVGATNPPVTITNLMGSVQGKTNFVLTWTAVPTTASYSVLYSTNAEGPYSTKLATGLTFPNTSGSYTDLLRTNVANFYEVSSP